MNFTTNTKVVQISRNHIIFEMELTEPMEMRTCTASIVVDRKLKHAIISQAPDNWFNQIERIVGASNGTIMKTARFIFDYKD